MLYIYIRTYTKSVCAFSKLSERVERGAKGGGRSYRRGRADLQH